MLNEFVLQYDRAVSSQRKVEEDQDHRTLHSKSSLHIDHPIEERARECYTRNLYEIFRKEWKASLEYFHETISKDANLIKYRVGLYKLVKINGESWNTT